MIIRKPVNYTRQPEEITISVAGNLHGYRAKDVTLNSADVSLLLKASPKQVRTFLTDLVCILSGTDE